MNSDHAANGILVEGRNCWRKSKADRASVVIDGAAYFSAFARAVENAQHSIYITGWDVDSRIALRRAPESEIESSTLGPFLNRVVASTRGLRAYVLPWDFSMIFMFERELPLIFGLGWETHRRVHFHMDDEHPLGGSHHQKIVVVDDSIAFAGGLDLSRSRWDTPEHLLGDPRRINPDGEHYLPFHDVQILVDHEAAQSLGDLFRKRWYYATGERLSSGPARQAYPWPMEEDPDFTDVQVAIARTEPLYKDRPQVTEVANLYVDAIAAARRFIYIENQYVTSSRIGDALAARLQDKDGPEIVVVIPFASSGWLEERVMDTRRDAIFKRLEAADLFNRLLVCYPVLPGLPSGDMIIHSKVLIVDDDLVRVGSSNLSNRSMGLDTECDLAIETRGDERLRKRIALVRSRLLGEHLAAPPDEIQEQINKTGSLIKTIQRFGNSDRTLKPLPPVTSDLVEVVAPSLEILDPEKPIEMEKIVERLVPSDSSARGGRDYVIPLIVLLVMVSLTIAWQWGPLAEWISLDALVSLGGILRDHPIAPLAVLAVYVVGGLCMVPVMLLIAATALVFSPVESVAYAFAGSLASASINYFIGRKLGKNAIRRLAGRKLNRVSRALAKRGLLTVASIRLVPIAPFQLVNIIMGASHIQFRDFCLGTLIGLAPGILGLSFFADTVYGAIREPNIQRISVAAIVLVISAIVFFIMRKMLAKFQVPEQRT